VEALHLKVDKMPEEYVAESLLKSLEGENLESKRVLLPRAAVARDVIPVELRRRGAIVDVVEAYRTVIPADAADRVREALSRKPHWITFTSSSTVTNFVAVLDKPGREALDGIKIASIGPITSATLREHGTNVDVEADPHTIGGLVKAISTIDQKLRASS
jgi:uroporphyrinogen-III synthase